MVAERIGIHDLPMRHTTLSPLLLILLLVLDAGTASAQSAGRGGPLADWEVFGQAGWAESDVSSYAIGAQRPLPWRTQFLGASLRSYAEVTVSRWIANEPGTAGSNRFTQFGVAPVLRVQHPDMLPGLFLDLGVGAYLITPIYQHNGKRFGSAHNFGDQIGVGFLLGRDRSHEISLRLQHFSNGGIKQPNPGENFLQARFLVRFAD